jgi:hypothetical protein
MSDDLKSFMGFEDLFDCEKSFRVVGERGFRRQSRIESHVRLLRRGVALDSRRHSNSPCCAFVTSRGKHGEYVRHTYVQPHYVPVGRHEFDTIEIAIYNDAGKPMPFQYGKVGGHSTLSTQTWTITFI